MGTEAQKDEQRTQLKRRHLDEWNAQLTLEVETRIALADQHKREHEQAYLDEINVQDRTALVNRHLDAIHQLVHDNRATRISMRKRHTQEADKLNQHLI